jgi:hypothetical protein
MEPAGKPKVVGKEDDDKSPDSEKTVHNENDQTSGRDKESVEWRERLLSVKETDSWSVGANIGMELVRMPGDEPYKILAENWKDISDNARQQILKGFSPGMMGNTKMHPHFFDVMHLGMSDPKPAVREYAAAYLEMQGLPNFAKNPTRYATWWKENKDRSAKEILEQNNLPVPTFVE